jgi:hypothetical protein
MRQEFLLRIIDLCESVRKKGLDPFDVEVREFFDRLRELLPKLQRHEELYLDVQAVLALADVIYQQGEWIKHRSSMLYLDPLLIELKLHALPSHDLAEVLTNSWHPIIELESLSAHGIAEANQYWANLPSLEERWRHFGTPEAPEEISWQELVRLGILSKEDFETELDRLWEELKHAAGESKVDYWDFILEQSFEETIDKAWLVSFLVSYGYAALELNPLEEEVWLKPQTKPKQLEQTFSVPIAISHAEWLRRKGG